MALAPMLSGAPAAAGLVFLLELVLKGTLVLGLAALLVLALRRSSAAHRHLVWTCALVALMALPWMQFALPAWKVSTPLAWIPPGFGLLAAATQPRAELPPSDPSAQEAEPATDPSTGSAGNDAAAQAKADDATSHAADGAVPGTTAADSKSSDNKRSKGESSPRRPAEDPTADSGRPVPSGIPFAGLALIFWAVGTVAVLSMFVAGHLVLRLMIHGARPVRDGEWHALALEAADRLGLTLPFALLRAKGILVPVATGLVRPRVLLPDGCDAWPVELRRAVLLHELAHVQRHDCLTQAIAQVACALFWFHPGVWWATSRLQIERERACDDRVLEAQTRASDYADHLLGMVRSLRARRLAALGAVAFARPSSLEGRLLAVLDPARDRRAVGRRVAVPAALAASLLVLPFAALEPVAAKGVTVNAKLTAGRGLANPNELRPSRVVPVPDPGRPLAERVAWARSDAGRTSARAYWVAWLIETSPTLRGNLLSDSEGIDLSILGRRGAFTLEDVIAGREQGTSDPRRSTAHDEHAPAAVLVRMASGAPDRVRVQTPVLPADFRGEPLYWLDAVADEQAFAWLRDAAERSGEARLRARFVESIGFMKRSELVSPYLTATFKGGASDAVRIGAAEGLSRHPSPEGVRLLTEAAHTDRSPEVRRASVEALGQFQTKEALESLLAIAGEGGGDGTRDAAFDALEDQVARRAPDAESAPDAAGRSGTSSKASTPGTPSKASKPDKSGKADKPSKEKSPPTVSSAPEDSAPEPELADMVEGSSPMSHQDLEVQRQAIESLGRYPEAQSLPRLRRIAETSPNGDLRAAAVESIGRLGTPAALAALEEIAWKNRSAHARDMAVESMGRRFPPEPALDKLGRIAGTHFSSETRRLAVEAIGRVDSPRANDQLARIIAESGDLESRRQAVESLGRREGAGIESKLAEIARSQQPQEVRRQAVESLGRREGDGISNQLVEIARTNSSEEVRRQAVESLGRRDDPEVPKMLQTIARENVPEDVQRQAVESLGRLSDPNTPALLAELARTHSSVEVQRQAVESLGRQTDARTRGLLLDLVRSHGSQDVQRQAVESLGRLENDAKGEIMNDLAAIARNHPSGEVRRQAVESMTRRDPDRALTLLEKILSVDPK